MRGKWWKSVKQGAMNPISMVAASLLLLVLLPLIYQAVALNNLLLTGQTLGTDEVLEFEESRLIMQGDCNLVLYTPLGFFMSNTARQGPNCTLTLGDDGRLVIRSQRGQVWARPHNPNTRGNYAGVLRPDGQFVVYGPVVWNATTQTQGAPYLEEPQPSPVGNIPMVRNVLFTGQILYGNGMLSIRDATFFIWDDCNLVLQLRRRTIWQSGTSGKGTNCFVRLDRRGRISILTDSYTTVWTSEAQGSRDGEYVLVLQESGLATVYGPITWQSSTPNNNGDGEMISIY